MTHWGNQPLIQCGGPGHTPGSCVPPALEHSELNWGSGVSMCHSHGQHQLTSPRIIFAASVLCNQIVTALNKQWVKSIILYAVEGIVGISPGHSNIHGSPDWWADPIAGGGSALLEVPWSPWKAPTCMFPPSVSHDPGTNSWASWTRTVGWGPTGGSQWGDGGTGCERDGRWADTVEQVGMECS